MLPVLVLSWSPSHGHWENAWRGCRADNVRICTNTFREQGTNSSREQSRRSHRLIQDGCAGSLLVLAPRAPAHHQREEHTLVLSPRRRRFAIGLVVAVGAMLAAYLARAPILTGAARLLIVEDPPERADVIFVLAGEAASRPQKAAELYGAGWAPRVVIPRPEDDLANELGVMPNRTDAAVQVMEQLGVPRAAIVVLTTPGGSTSTIDDARLFRNFAEQYGIRRALVVTSMFHTRRARWVLRKVMRGFPVKLIMVPAGDPRFQVNNWWQHEEGLLFYAEEWLKWIHNASRF